jgi:hypothetical protein
VDADRLGRGGGCSSAVRAPQHGADARDHLGAGERLDDVVVGAQLEADDAVGLGPARGHHDHGDVALGA